MTDAPRRTPVPLAERWALDEEALADNPNEVEQPPRWQVDQLDGYDPETTTPPWTVDDFPGNGR
jgi:hypothetical protein